MGLIPELAKKLPAPAPDLHAVIAAPSTTDAAVIMRIVRTLSASGYKDVAYQLVPPPAPAPQ